jgi:hypothetical protein
MAVQRGGEGILMAGRAMWNGVQLQRAESGWNGGERFGRCIVVIAGQEVLLRTWKRCDRAPVHWTSETVVVGRIFYCFVN